ncbi:terminase large subunit domain-containing protein [Sphingomonas aliaeris]|uniref:terminase large subunit domain-containing protein n=1 Tax=Sphingomonas aliaeris TaxID=2759526 RepID=UPI001923F8E8|nr:terminase large subunit [Sphingomonas aliaeris]
MEPRVRSSTGGFIPYRAGPREAAEIAKALDGQDISVAVFCWPRRHGKSVTSAMIIVWRFLTRRTEMTAVVANSEKQVVDTAFRSIREAFEQTPFLKNLTKSGTVNVLADRIELPSTGSTIQAFSANPAALWGKKLSCAQVSELHAAPRGDEVFAALAGSLLDTAGSLMLIDSTVSAKSSKLYELYQAATHQTDPDHSISFSHIEYSNLDDACRNAPPWINETKLRSLARQMLPHEFALYHLNRWGDAASTLFPADMLAACTHEYPLDLPSLAAGSAYVVGAGLDRAFGGSRHGDRTVTACVVKIVVDDDEHLYVLDANSVFMSRLSVIKARFEGYHCNQDMTRATLESYGAQDVADWCASQPYGSGVETIHPSRKSKYGAFMGLYQAAAEQRLHIHPVFKELLAELAVFEVHADGKATDGEAAVPKFTHPRGAHDDYVHAVAWAAHSLRHVSLNPYEIEGIHCNGRGPDVAMCALNGGAHVPLCARSCRSMREASRLFDDYVDRRPVDALAFPAFLANKLKNIGAHSIPR